MRRYLREEDENVKNLFGKAGSVTFCRGATKIFIAMLVAMLKTCGTNGF